MNDSTRKLLTKMIGECWHLFNLPYEITERCGKCGKVRSEAYNRTFDTPDDQHAVMQAICKAGKWGEFWKWAKYHKGAPILMYEFDEWLFSSPSRFCELAGKWAETLTER